MRRLPLTRKEVVQIRKELEADLKKIETEKDKVLWQMRKLQNSSWCKHPQIRRIGPMGMEKRCPDCGYQT